VTQENLSLFQNFFRATVTHLRGLQTPRFGGAASLLINGKGLVLGGANAGTNAIGTAEMYQ